MEYEAWNDGLAAYFFNEEMAGREVLLYVTGELIESIGASDGAGVEDFVEAVIRGPTHSVWVDTVCEKAALLCKHQRIMPRHYPPYLAYLALFVYAATISGDFEPNEYYPKLCEILGEPVRHGSYPGFYKMVQVWDALEGWTREQKEELGRFTRRRRGGYAHVGIPWSQLVLSEEERAHLPEVFYSAPLDPADPPPDEVLRKALLDKGKKLLTARTMRLLQSQDTESKELLDALLDFVLEELSDWDCAVPDTVGVPGKTSAPKTVVGLYICLEGLDTFLHTVKPYLRIKTNLQIPGDGLLLQYDGSPYMCLEAEPGWTTRLKDSALSPPTYFDASRLDWMHGAMLIDAEANWEARLKGAAVRLFTQRPFGGIHGWIECSELPRRGEFLVACHEDCLEVVAAWGGACKRLEEVDITGLPNQWTLFEGEGATASCQGVDSLTLPTQVHMYLEGGIKTGKGNEYLRFAPPAILVAGAAGGERVAVDGRVLISQDDEASCWTLPPDVLRGTALEIQLLDEENEVPLRKRSIRLADPSLSPGLDETLKLDKFGQVLPNGEADKLSSSVRGAIVHGTWEREAPAMQETLPLFLSHRILLVGSRPGEVADWPREGLPVGWRPVWALAKKGKDQWEVHYCGPKGLEPPLGKSGPERTKREIKRWKESVWVNRKRNRKPTIKQLTRLWQEFEEVARGV